jgi:amino acid transporter
LQGGLGLGTLIIVLSNIVTTITALSLCAICTNGEVKGGGAYYLISRALGPTYGGSIGLLFFFAQAVAVSMYVVGFSESVVDLMKQGGGVPFTGLWAWDLRVIGIITSVVLLCVALVGVGWYAKCQIFLLIALISAIMSSFIGGFFPDVPNAAENAAQGFVGFSSRNLWPEFSSDPDTGKVHGFFTVFSVFFPAVTGEGCLYLP